MLASLGIPATCAQVQYTASMSTSTGKIARGVWHAPRDNVAIAQPEARLRGACGTISLRDAELMWSNVVTSHLLTIS